MQDVSDERPYYVVARVEEVPPSTVRRVRLAGHGIALANVDGEFYAFEDRCLHWGVRLSEGVLLGTRLRCRLHGWIYDLSRGVVEMADDETAVGSCMLTFPVRVVEGQVLVSPIPRRASGSP